LIQILKKESFYLKQEQKHIASLSEKYKIYFSPIYSKKNLSQGHMNLILYSLRHAY